jgi:hypothetical protein
LYPIIKRALVHFVAEAKEQNEITEREETPEPKEAPVTIQPKIDQSQ